MRSFITYQPSRDNDLLAFMGQYQKADTAHRPAILEHLRSCMDGKKYPNPYAESYQYTTKDVKQCEQILEHYLDRLPDCRGDDSNKIYECVRQTTCEINVLNEQCGGALIDSWRRERLCSFLNDAAAGPTGACAKAAHRRKYPKSQLWDSPLKMGTIRRDLIRRFWTDFCKTRSTAWSRSKRKLSRSQNSPHSLI